MTAAAPGVLRRPRLEVPETLTVPISVFRPAERDHGQFVVDAAVESLRAPDDLQTFKRRRRRGGR